MNLSVYETGIHSPIFTKELVPFTFIRNINFKVHIFVVDLPVSSLYVYFAVFRKTNIVPNSHNTESVN